MRRAAGIMTGTSLDGIDIAICSIEDGSPERIVLDAFQTLPYPEDLADRIRAMMTEPADAAHINRLDHDLARAYADAVRAVADPSTLDVIGMHGQTIWHEPPVGSWQAGNGVTLATLLGVPVVHDMRSTDIALGGQGAPLVPLFDHAVLSRADAHVVALNIGGMANVTSLPPSATLAEVTAFDTGPGNVLIDAAVRMLFGKRYDADGAIARAGRVIPRMFEHLQQHPYIHRTPPKSTGRESFSDTEMTELIRRYGHGSIPSEDVVSTVTEFTAWSIAHHIDRYMSTASVIVVSGGGANNSFLMERLRGYVGERNVITSDAVGVPSEAKEAMCWAYLAWRTMAGRPGNVPSVTGAERPAILGSIASSVGIV